MKLRGKGKKPDRYTSRLIVMMTASEKKYIRMQAKKHHLSISSYVRMRVI